MSFVVVRRSCSSVADGESKTAAFSEFVKGRGYTRPNDVSVWYNNSSQHSVPWGDGTEADANRHLEALVAGCRQGAADNAQPWAHKGELAFMGEAARGIAIGFSGPPNLYSCGNGVFDRYPWEFGLSSAQSSHPGGVNVALLDASVHFVSDSVDVVTWRALGTRAGHEKNTSNF